MGQTQDYSLGVVDPSADRNLTIQQLIDFIKRDFSVSPYFSETIPGISGNNGGNGVRYSIEEYSEEDHRDIVAILQLYEKKYVFYLKKFAFQSKMVYSPEKIRKLLC